MKHSNAARQRGISFIGLLFLGVVLALLVIVGARVVPTARNSNPMKEMPRWRAALECFM